MPDRRAGVSWIRRFHEAPGSGARLICLPHAGGSANFFHPLSAALTPELEVLAIQYPGRQDSFHQPPLGSVPELADQVTEQLAPWTGSPLALFGHSLGAAVAFEVAQRLGRRPGIRLTHLFASGRLSPQRPGDAHQRDDRGLVEVLRSLNGTDPAILDDPGTLQILLPTIRTDFKASETYRPAPGAAVDCPVTVLIGEEDLAASPGDARSWAEHTTGSFGAHIFPGGHFYLTSQVAEVSRVISARLS